VQTSHMITKIVRLGVNKQVNFYSAQCRRETPLNLKRWGGGLRWPKSQVDVANENNKWQTYNANV